MKEGNRAKSRAFLVFGAPCSGKTTFSEHFAKRFQAPFYNLTELKAAYNLNRKMLMMVIEQVAKTGTTLVFEGEIGTEAERTEIRNILRRAGYDPILVWIQTDVSTIRSRMKQRTKSPAKAKEMYENGVRELEAPNDLESPIVLSGKHTFETQLRHVLSQLR